MGFGLYWKQICGIMAALFMITALAGAAAAVILLVRARLYERLAGEAGAKYRKTGILALIAVCVWIMVIGQSAAAAEAGSTRQGASEEESGSTQQSAAAEESGSTQQSAAAEEGSTREQAASEEPADPENPEDSQNPAEPDHTEKQEKPADEQAPSVRIEMDRDANRGSDGTLYCREDNAGICVILEETGSADTGIKDFRIVVTDSEGREITRQWSAAEAEENKRCVQEEIRTEETARLSDGEILVRAEAVDGAGNTAEAVQRFVLDTCPPVLTEMMTYRVNAGADGDSDDALYKAEGGILYEEKQYCFEF